MSTSTASYDDSVALDRKLTQEEGRELKILLMPYFHATGESDASPEDINDLLDYAFAMVNNQKSVEYVIKELVGMEMEFCNSTIAEKVGSELSGFLQKILKVEGKLTSIKPTSSKGNALTMSGALGSSREGGRNNNKSGNNRDGKGGKHSEKRRDDRRGDRGRNNRGGRSTHKEAFDRLSNNNGNRRGKDNDRGDRRRRDDDRGGRGGRRGRDGRRDSGRGGRSGGGDRGDRNDRSSGNRRTRDEYENEEFMPMRDEGRGRGRGRGRGGREGTAKRQRYDDYYDEGYGDDGYYDDGYWYGGYHGYGGRGGYGFPGRGRGRGRFGGRGRGGRGRGRGEGSNEAGNSDAVTDANAATGNSKEGAAAMGANASDAANHPSPLVQASYSGGRGGYGGRGRFGRGRGRGRGGGRAHVVSMIQSKTWVRKKPEDTAANAEAKPADAPPPME